MVVHITAGGLGIVSGFLALYSAKGAWLHRRSGIVFVCAMVVMALSGAVIAALRGAEASVIGGMLACYLVITALATVRPRGAQSGRLDVGLMVVALAIALASLLLGFDAVGRGGVREGIPAVVLFKFALVALLAGAGDLRVIRAGALRGAPRLARHLWRMCFALYIATASFFFGQADKLPEALRVPALLAFPVVAVVVTMFYWLWRVRIRRSLRGIVNISAPEAA
jgi:uncharacterized membrane protein